MRKLMLISALGLASVPPICAAQTAASVPLASVTAIRAGKFIDVQTGHVLANQVILIRGAKIDAVGANIAIPEGANIIDLSKMTVLPGLSDCHPHVADIPNPEPLSSQRLPSAVG